ncbi:hypothetical protein LSAT2_009058 [Lamellibrachia satsuma]|nr:hypothetical protein LSAT2_009058 [Lamellibrachia satsuma]
MVYARTPVLITLRTGLPYMLLWLPLRRHADDFIDSTTKTPSYTGRRCSDNTDAISAALYRLVGGVSFTLCLRRKQNKTLRNTGLSRIV